MNEKVLTWFTAPVKRKQVHFDVAGVANNDNEPNLTGLDGLITEGMDGFVEGDGEVFEEMPCTGCRRRLL